MKNKKTLIENFINAPTAPAYFGGAFELKRDVLTALIYGGNLAEIGRKHGCTRAAVSKQLCRARRIFNIT